MLTWAVCISVFLLGIGLFVWVQIQDRKETEEIAQSAHQQMDALLGQIKGATDTLRGKMHVHPKIQAFDQRLQEAMKDNP